ncbi:endonuclease V [Pelomyxa schiedti]|nr:endonuclease V [Pelomyxa schiedti]
MASTEAPFVVVRKKKRARNRKNKPTTATSTSSSTVMGSAAESPPPVYCLDYRTKLSDPSWDVKQRWMLQQVELRNKLILTDDHNWFLPGAPPPQLSSGVAMCPLTLVAGMDISFFPGSEVDACASMVVLNMPSLSVVFETHALIKLTEPYVPGFLAFREAPALLEILKNVRNTCPQFTPQVIMLDGNGTLHPRGFGLASHLGVLADIPTLGVAKTMMFADGIGDTQANFIFNRFCSYPGTYAPLIGATRGCIGAVVRSNNGSNKPLYVSVGHKLSLDTAIALTLQTCIHRVPEPTRQADLRSRNVIAAVRHT